MMKPLQKRGCNVPSPAQENLLVLVDEKAVNFRAFSVRNVNPGCCVARAIITHSGFL